MDQTEKEKLLYSLKINAEQRVKSLVVWNQRRKLTLLAGIFLLALVIFGLSYFFSVPKVEVSRAEVVQEGLPEIALTAGAYVVADSTILVSSQINGQVKSVLVEEGDQVKAGQILAEIEDDDYRAKYASANAELALAAATLRRKSELFRQGVISRAEFDEAQRAHGVAKAAEESAKYFFESTKVKAPIDGTVIKKEKEPGEYLLPGITSEGIPGSAVIKIADLRVMNVEMDILESDLPKIHQDQAAMVFPDALPDHSYSGKLFYIAPQADRQKSIVLCKVRIDQADALLKPEMSARVYLLKEAPKQPVYRRVVVPESALFKRGGDTFVFIVNKDRLEEKKVEVAAQQNGQASLSKGLDGDETVVDRPRVRFRPGMKVSVKVNTPSG